jgi:protein TonB
MWMNPQAERRRFAAALVAGLLLELGGLALLLPAMSHKEMPATVPARVKLSIIAPAPAPKPPPVPKPTPKPVPPKPVTPPPLPKPVTPPPPPLPMAPPLPPPPRPVVHHIIRHVAPPRPKYTPPPVPQPPRPEQQPRLPVAQTPPPPPAPPAPTGGQVDAFSAAIKRALQAHANEVYPQAAQMAGEIGAPQLTFTYLNGVVTGITLTRSSGYPLLDKAALEDARIASYPPPPQGFQGRTYHITVTVTFQMAAPDVDGD